MSDAKNESNCGTESLRVKKLAKRLEKEAK